MREKIHSIGIVKESRFDESRAPIAPNQVSKIIKNILILIYLFSHVISGLLKMRNMKNMEQKFQKI